MPPVTLDELEYIDSESTPTANFEMLQNGNSKNREVRQLMAKLEKLRASPVFQMMLRIQNLAQLYEEQTRLTRRNAILTRELADREAQNRLKLARLEVLRADRRRRQENISAINLRILDETNQISVQSAANQKSRRSNGEIKDQITIKNKELLREYLEFINGENIITNLSSSKPTIKPKSISIKQSKTKKMFEEFSILSEGHNISQFLTAASTVMCFPLRFPLHWNGIQTHYDENGAVTIPFSDPKAALYLHSLIEQFNTIKVVKKNRNLVSFLQSSTVIPPTSSISLNSLSSSSKTLLMRDALFAHDRNAIRQRNGNAVKSISAVEEIPDFT